MTELQITNFADDATLARLAELESKLAAEREAHEATRAALAEAQKDVEMLDWAESNPVAAYSNIVAQWADCGRGGRESFFNFRHAIDAARKETK